MYGHILISIKNTYIMSPGSFYLIKWRTIITKMAMYRTQEFICFYTEQFLAPKGRLHFQQVSCYTSYSINLWVGFSYFFILRTHNFEGSIGNMLRIVWILGNLSSVEWTINYSGHSNIIINLQNRIPILYRMRLYLCAPTHITHKH